MKLLSRSACRVDMAGGTLDIWPLFLYHQPACTVNFAVDIYTSCSIETRDDRKLILRSDDLKTEETYSSLEELDQARKTRLALHVWLLRTFRPEVGVTMTTHSESPAGAGISGSSSLMITAGAALNKLCGTNYKIEKLREVVQNVESQIIRVPTGAQDYYPAMYGGVAAIALSAAGVKREGIAVDLDEFNSRVVLAYTGEPRNSGINNWEVMKANINGDRKVQRNFDKIASIATAMRRAVEKADWTEAGRLLQADWDHRRRNIPTMTTETIDRLVSVARRKGATGARACGAGGGGCVFFLVEPDAKEQVTAVLEEEGVRVLPVTVAPQGVKVKVVQ
ncbi:MAG: hypothetical protein IT168_25010 [Bryobacterales bacterium]|nr:hypothetical protein [Bryobacterales bacterium]